MLTVTLFVVGKRSNKERLHVMFDPIHTIVFDLETRKGPQDVGGWPALKAGKGGVSALVAYDSETDDHYLYDDHTLADFARVVEQPGVVLVGYNSIEFDLPIVTALLGRRIALKYHVDIFSYIKDALDRENRTRERGWRLGETALRAMGISKNGEGVHAPELADQHRYAELINYCRADVDLTRQLLDYIRRHGGVADHDGSILELDIPPWLRLPPQAALET